MLRVTIFLISFFIGCEANSLLSADDNVVHRSRVGNTDMVLEVQKEHAHFFLAEYDFRFILKRGANIIDLVVVADTGGRSRVDVLRDVEGRTVLRHYERNICLDRFTRSFDDYCDIQKDAVHIGSFDFDSTKRWRFSPNLN